MFWARLLLGIGNLALLVKVQQFVESCGNAR
jgi:hypothetical protein